MSEQWFLDVRKCLKKHMMPQMMKGQSSIRLLEKPYLLWLENLRIGV